MSEPNERLAVVETQMIDTRQHVVLIERKLDQQQETIDEFQKTMLEQVAAIRTELTRYKGMWGGIMLTLSALGALLTVVWKPLAQMFGKSQ
jgi:hypothetical protein